jgi:hypothetical protein
VPRVGKQQDHPASTHVALFEVDPTDQGLDVADPGLSLDDSVEGIAVDHAVGRSSVAGDGYRDLDPPSEAGPKSPMQALEQGEMCDVTHR